MTDRESTTFAAVLSANLPDRGHVARVLPGRGEHELPVEPPEDDRPTSEPPKWGRIVPVDPPDRGFRPPVEPPGRVVPPPRRPVDPDPDLPETAGFDEVEQEASRLRQAVEELVRREEQLLQQEIDQQNRENPGIIATVRAHVSESGPLLKQSIDLALDALDAYLANVLGPHAEVPRQLEEEGDELRARGTTTQEIATEMGGLLDVEAWEGEAAEAYAQAATVQHKATQELAGMMLSGGAALQRAADLNRATFFLVAERLRMGRRSIEMLSRMGMIGGRFFLRLRMAAGHLRRIMNEIEEMVSSVQEGESATDLAADLDALADMPNVLDPLHWPSGMDRADREPADTAGAITRDTP